LVRHTHPWYLQSAQPRDTASAARATFSVSPGRRLRHSPRAVHRIDCRRAYFSTAGNVLNVVFKIVVTNRTKMFCTQVQPGKLSGACCPSAGSKRIFDLHRNVALSIGFPGQMPGWCLRRTISLAYAIETSSEPQQRRQIRGFTTSKVQLILRRRMPRQIQRNNRPAALPSLPVKRSNVAVIVAIGRPCSQFCRSKFRRECCHPRLRARICTSPKLRKRMPDTNHGSRAPPSPCTPN